MDIDVLQNLLDEKTDYQETTKSIFLKKLWIRFEEFKQRDTKFHNYEGSCKVKNGPCVAVNFGKERHVFIAKNSRLYLPLIFVNNPDGSLKSPRSTKSPEFVADKKSKTLTVKRLAFFINKTPWLSKVSNFKVFLSIPNSQNQKYIVLKKSLLLIKPKSPCATT